MAALTIVGIALAIAIPTYSNMVRQVRASQAVADLQTLRAAAYLYFGDHAEWPDEVQAGAVPIGLRPYLPEKIELMNQWYRIDWDNWMIWDNPGGPSNAKGKGSGLGKARSKFPQTGVLVGVSLITDDPELMAAARGMLANTSFIQVSVVKSTLKLADADGF
jgi:type II secretory pathway pseudopilin PulG